MASKKNQKILSTPVNPAELVTPAGKGLSSSSSIHLKLALFLALVSFLVYANTLMNGYVLDDSSAITQNTIVTKGISAIPEILSTPYRRGYWVAANDSYRPLSLVMFAIEYQLFGKNPFPNHLVNVLLYAGCVVLLFKFLNLFFDGKKVAVAFIASLLFALHPIHTEVVANIKSRDELLSFFFAILSLHVYIKYVKSGRTAQLVLGSFCFLLSILSKETVISFLAVIILIFVVYWNENKKRTIYISVGSSLAAIIYFIARLAVLKHYHANEIAIINFIDNPLAKTGLPFLSRMATATLILGYYIKLLFIPYPLICDYSYNAIPFVDFDDPKAIISLAVYILLAIFGIWRFVRNRKDPFAFCIFFFIITMALYSNIFFLIAATLAERFLFLSSVAFCLAVALILEKWAGKGLGPNVNMLKMPKILGVIIPLSLVYSFMTFARNSEWADNETLYSADLKKAPESAKLNFWLGNELEAVIAKEEKDPTKQQQIKNEGIKYMSRSIAICPDYEAAQSELCAAYFFSGQYDSAAIHGTIALGFNPTNISTLNNMGGVYFNKKDYKKAITLYESAISIKPTYVDPYTNNAVCYLSLGVVDSGIHYLKEAIAVDPSYARSYDYLATAYKSVGKLDSAEKYETIANKYKK